MSIRLLAQDLYRLQREVAELEKRLAAASEEEREAIAARLRELRADRDRLKSALEAKKEAPLARRPH